MMNVLPVSVRTKRFNVLFYCAGILFNLFSPFCNSFSLQTCFVFVYNSIYSTNCVFFALDSISLSLSHSSIRTANFGVPFIQRHLQFFESFCYILFYGSISSTSTVNSFLRKLFRRCLFSDCFLSFCRFFMVLFWFWLGLPKFASYHLKK